MHNRLTPKGMCLRSRDLFEFWEISDDISEMVQDRDSCNGRLIRDRMWPIERRMAPLSVICCDLEGYFALRPFCLKQLGKYSVYYLLYVYT